MKLLFDFFPIIVFFIVFKQYEDPQEGVLAATAAIIVATAIQMGVTWWRQRRIEKMHMWTLGLVVFFGGLTLYFQDEMFIKWKPSIVNWLFALAFAGSQLFMKKSIVRRMLEASVSLPDRAWTGLNLAWVGFFVFCGIANLYVVYNYDTNTWVDFKLFGMLGLTFLFMLGQVLFLMKYASEQTPDEDASKTADGALDGSVNTDKRAEEERP